MSLESQVKNYAVGKLTYIVGSGECSDLAEKALINAGCKTTRDYGKTGPDVDYVWGKSINIKSAVGGDVLQFRNYLCTDTTTVKTVITQKNGSWTSSTKINTVTSEGTHHTAVVETGVQYGAMGILEQNWKDPTTKKYVKKVRRKKLYIDSFATVAYETWTDSKGVHTSVTTKRTVTVSGVIWPFVPVKK